MSDGRDSGGPGKLDLERFDEYMERCLYGAGGFYSTTGSAGRRGDFITSPEVGPLFGAVLTRAIRSWWAEVGSPEPFTVVDAGCGPGTLLRSIRQAAGSECPWRLLGIDRAAQPGVAHSLAAAGIDMAAELPDDLSSTVVIGNEILDNMPTRILLAGGQASGDQEVFVRTVDGVPTEVCLPGSTFPTAAAFEHHRLDVGTRFPLHQQAVDWLGDVLERQPISVCVFDYGAPTTVELASRGGWLRTYQGHGRGDDPYVDPGRWDITTDVAFDQLPTPAWLGRQADFLTAWGIDTLVEEGRRYWADHAHAPDLEAMKMRSRVTEAPALLDMDGLGNWMTAVWSRDVMPIPDPTRDDQ